MSVKVRGRGFVLVLVLGLVRGLVLEVGFRIRVSVSVSVRVSVRFGLVLGFRTCDSVSFGGFLNSHIICRHSVVGLGEG